MPRFDVKKLLAEDEINKGLDLPYRFGYAFKVDYNMQNSGTWSKVSGGKVWSLKIVSKGAYSINLAFSKFYLPKDSRLYIYNEQKTVIQGPYTSDNNTKDGKLSSDLIEGSAIILEYFEADNVKEKPEISISKVVHAYRNLFSNSTKSYDSSESCNIDVNCPEGDDWQDESDAVAMILINNNALCSGCMVNNTAQDFTPYFLTANHCISGKNVDNWTFRFQYKSPTCGGGDDYSYYSYYGANLETNSSVSDFAFLELNTRPSGNTGITYAGWSRNATAPNSAVGIHHPSGDVMKISIDNSSPTQVNYDAGNGTSQCWRVIWNEGTTEGGSSGSPLFNTNHRIIGQLYGGTASCSNTSGHDNYGRFDVSWTHGLSQFLDPANTGAMTINTIKIPYVTGTNIVCTSNSTFTLQNRPPGSTITWTKSSNLAYVGGQGTNNYTVRATGTGNGWVQASVNGTPFRKTVWVGRPGQPVTNPYGYPTVQMSLGQIKPISVTSAPGYHYQQYIWNITGSIKKISGGGSQIVVEAVNTGWGNFRVKTRNQCGYSADGGGSVNVSSGGGGGGMMLSVSPNPASSDMTISVISENEKDISAENEQWDLEIYNLYYVLQVKRHVKGSTVNINTSAWKEGIYMIKAICKGNVLSERVIIKK